MKRIVRGTFAPQHPILWGLFVGLALGANLVSADTPRASFGSALITGADNRITVTRVPVIDSAGKVTYRDVTVNFNVSNTGALTLGTPTNNPSPNLVTSGFQAGDYKDSRGNVYKVTGPSVIPGTTRTLWALALVSAGFDATKFSMSWVTGSVAGHPNQSSLTPRKITSSSFSWGIVGARDGSSAFPFWGWDNSEVVGAAQAGNQIVFYLFEGADDIADKSMTLTKQ